MSEYENLELRGRTDESRISLDEAWEFRTSVIALADTAPVATKKGQLISLDHDPFAVTPEEGRHTHSGYRLSVFLHDESTNPDSWHSQVLFREGIAERDGSLDRARSALYELDVQNEQVTRASRKVTIARNTARVERDVFGNMTREIIDSQRRSFELQLTSQDISYVVGALQRADKLPRRRKAA
jgi:hypothetical protein